MATATAIVDGGEAAAAVGDGVRNLPTDAFMEVLLRLPPSKLRVLRLVCRHWRAVVDERAPPARRAVRPLAFVVNYADSHWKTSAATSFRRWRELGASCCLDAGIVSVGGAMYWVTDGARSVASLDLREERVATAVALPVDGARGSRCHLTEVDGMPGLAVGADRPAPAKTEVWVLGDGWRLSRRCSVQVSHGVPQQLARPHFARGDYVLTNELADGGRRYVLGHRLRGAGTARCGPCGSASGGRRCPA
ncbi:hypothetical protein ACP4OV_017896 [Aristida adscensionis]